MRRIKLKRAPMLPTLYFVSIIPRGLGVIVSARGGREFPVALRSLAAQRTGPRLRTLTMLYSILWLSITLVTQPPPLFVLSMTLVTQLVWRSRGT